MKLEFSLQIFGKFLKYQI